MLPEWPSYAPMCISYAIKNYFFIGVPLKKLFMKNIILLLALVFCYAGLQAQKESAVKKTDTKLVNQKLVQLQSTLKKLETTLNEAKALMNDLQKQKDAISELSKDDMLWLQKLMEKKSQLEQMISNIMKAGSETQNNITNNLKAS